MEKLVSVGELRMFDPIIYQSDTRIVGVINCDFCNSYPEKCNLGNFTCNPNLFPTNVPRVQELPESENQNVTDGERSHQGTPILPTEILIERNLLCSKECPCIGKIQRIMGIVEKERFTRYVNNTNVSTYGHTIDSMSIVMPIPDTLKEQFNGSSLLEITNSLIIMHNAGEPLNIGFIYLPIVDQLKCILDLSIFLQTMNLQKNIYHNSITINNIVYNSNKKKLILTDYEYFYNTSEYYNNYQDEDGNQQTILDSDALIAHYFNDLYSIPINNNYYYTNVCIHYLLLKQYNQNLPQTCLSDSKSERDFVLLNDLIKQLKKKIPEFYYNNFHYTKYISDDIKLVYPNNDTGHRIALFDKIAHFFHINEHDNLMEEFIKKISIANDTYQLYIFILQLLTTNIIQKPDNKMDPNNYNIYKNFCFLIMLCIRQDISDLYDYYSFIRILMKIIDGTFIIPEALPLRRTKSLSSIENFKFYKKYLKYKLKYIQLKPNFQGR